VADVAPISHGPVQPPVPSVLAAGSESRLPALDGIRGLAILMIMQYHFWGLAFGLSGRPRTLRIDEWVSDVRIVGWTSVDLFFVLSGFLITGILLDAKRESSNYFRSFYARRFLRIFPLYYAFLLFLLFVMPLTPEWAENTASIDRGAVGTDGLRDIQQWFWTYLVNVAAAIRPLDANVPLVHTHFWTLSLEEQFYLVWPLVVLALSRRQLIVVCAAMPAIALAIRVALVNDAFPSFFHDNAAHVLAPARMDTLALGALAALAVRGDLDLRKLASYAPYVAWASIGVLATLFAWRGGLEVFDEWTLTLGFTAAEFLWVSVLVLAITSGPRAMLVRFLSNRVMTAFGTYSYCMYIIHLLIGFELAVWVAREDLVRTAGGSQILFNLAFNTAATAICFGVSFLSWHLYEKQFLKLKVLFPYRRRTEPGAAPVPVAEGANAPAG
jgi:peptidoglycan/LPS O-acetylase OafA/YrhL